jgi:membrane-associated protease RseP (regulator of RpoE activity)
MQMLLFTALTLIAYLGITFLYTVSMAWLARRAGITVEVVSVGFGPALWARAGRHWRYEIGLLPFGGYTKFLGHGEEPLRPGEGPPPGSFVAVRWPVRLAVVILGPLTSVLLGLALLYWPVLTGAPQLVAGEAGTPVAPSGVGPLSLAGEPATWVGQFDLWQRTAVEYCYRVFTFESLEGWGGPVSAILTGGAVGRDSPVNWVGFMGVAALMNGCLNLLPVPLLNGFQALMILFGSVAGGRVEERVTIPCLYVGLLFVVYAWFRVVALDVAWLWANL